jgi:Tfp pilus assembly protein PilV
MLVEAEMRLGIQSKHRGFALMEALIAIVLLGVGVLGVAKLNGVLLQDSGLAKTRAEAMQLAQGQLEALREEVATQGCANFVDATDVSVSGLNANYSVSSEFTNPADVSAARENDRWLAVVVTVSWPDGDQDASNSQVVVSTLLNCRNSRSQAYAAGVEEGGDFLQTSTGRGRVGSRPYDGDDAGTANQVSGTDIADGTTTHTDGLWLQLVDANNRVVLEFEQTSCEQASDVDTGFSTISGKLFVKADKGAPIAETNELHVLSSDASYCSKLDYQDDWVLPQGATGTAIEFFYTYYQCYLGPGWWGNVGVIETETAGADHRVCVGNPTSADDGTDYTKIPRLSITRGYRGTLESIAGIQQAHGIGVDDSACGYTARHYTGHHWLFGDKLKNDADCASEETALDGLNPAGSLGDSPGKYVCLSTGDQACPAIGEDVTPPQTVVHGTIQADGGAVLEGIADTGACTATTFNGVGPYSYSCDISWEGFAGASWYGAIRFTTGAESEATLCAGEATAEVLPEGSTVAYVINDRTADPDPNAIKFTDVPKEVTDVTLDFWVRNSSCGTLGQPDVAWDGASDPKALVWAAINGAATYRTYSCSVGNQKDLTSCEPNTLASTSSDTRYTPSDPANKQTICLAVQAVDNAGSAGERSPVKCVFLAGNTYEYR